MGLDNPVHLLLLALIVLLVFGAQRLPEIGRSLGSGMRGFKDTLSGEAPTAVQAPAPLDPVLASSQAERERSPAA